MEKEITLCIPKVQNILQKDYIHRKLKKINAGKVQSIIEKPIKNEENYKRVLVKMRLNMSNDIGQYMMNHFSNGNCIKLVYHKSEYWRLVHAY